MLVRLEQAVIGAGYIKFRAALHTLVAAQQCGTFPIQFLPLCRREKLLVCIFRRTLQGCVRLIGPDALQIGFAPLRFHHQILCGAGFGRRLGHCERKRKGGNRGRRKSDRYY